MAEAALSIKLRCASWQQLATIYRRDLSRGSMFLKASTQPAIGTLVKIDLELPSATVIELTGVIEKHVVDPQRGTGVDLKLDALPTKSVWLIESALASENKVRATTAGDSPAPTSGSGSGQQTAISDGQDLAAAEQELIKALEAEVESLRKLNPFLVLGVGYETTDSDVRAAFGELTKRYHPDRFARYQSAKLRQIAAEIFILIRDAYRKLADEAGRSMVVASIGPRIPTRAQTQPRGSGPAPARIPAAPVPRIAVPPPSAKPEPPGRHEPPKPVLHDARTVQGSHDAPTSQSLRTAQLAQTELAKDPLTIPVESKPPPARIIPELKPRAQTAPMTPTVPTVPSVQLAPPVVVPPRPAAPPVAQDASDTSGLEALLDEGKLDEALNGYRLLAKKNPSDKSYRAGIELVEGMRALAARDRMEAAQRFETALEMDPSNERAARELADMRRQATNERKGLLSRLMGKKETP